MKLLHLALAASVIVMPAVAAPITPAPPADHIVHLSDSDLQVIRYVFVKYGGRDCSVADDAVDSCRAAVLARDVLIKLQGELTAPPPAAAKK